MPRAEMSDEIPVADPRALVALEALLSEIPTVREQPTVARVPRGLERRYAAVRLKCMDWMLDAVAAELPQAAMWSRLAVNLPWLILRDNRDKANEDRYEQPLGMRRAVADRLCLAEDARWAELVTVALDDERRAMTRGGRRNRRQTRREVLERSAEHAEDGALKTAVRLLRGDAILPPSPATSAAVAQLYAVGPRDEEAEGKLWRAAAAAAPHKTPAKPVSQRTVHRRILGARGTAHPGPSGERNRHVAALLSCPRALDTLSRWVWAWQFASLPSSVREPWMDALLVPLDKGGGKARPILLQEALLKLATGAVTASTARRLEARLRPWQYGAGGEGGAVRMAWELSSAMVEKPDDVFLSFDARNAFGTVLREAAVAEAADTCPELLGTLLSLWCDVSPTFWLEQADGTYEPSRVREGCVQGGCDAQPAFCLALHRAFRRFAESPAARAHEGQWRLWAYIDDVFLQCPHHAWSELAGTLVTELAAVGLEQRMDKCRAHIPAATADRIAAEAGSFAPFGKLVPDGLPILGSVAAGVFATTVGKREAAVQPAQTRLDRAIELIESIDELLHAPLEGAAVAPAWKLLATVANNALSYDACILPPALSRPLAERLDSAVLGAAARIAATDGFDSAQATQLRLPRAHGGCSLPSAAQRCDTSFLATFLLYPRAQSVTPAAWRAAGLTGAAEEAQHRITSETGVHIDGWGMPHREQPDEPLVPEHAPNASLPKRQRGWVQLAATIAKEAAGAELTERLEQCGGEEGGVFLTVNRSEIGGHSLSDGEFRTGLRLRLGIDVCAPGPCHHRSSRAGAGAQVCGHQLDAKGCHALACKVGGEVNVLHDAGCQIILGAVKAAGMRALLEQIVPELRSAARQEPRLDVEAWGLPACPRLLLDFTVRNTAAGRYASVRSSPAGVAAVAESEKQRTYPARGGVAVRGLSMEHLGRHGPLLAQTLAELADLARQRDADRGMAPRRWLRIWRAELSAACVRSCHRAIASANEDLQGRVTARPGTMQRMLRPGRPPVPSAAGGACSALAARASCAA